MSLSTLKLLLNNVSYRGDMLHKGVAYPGEQAALVWHELRLEVNETLKPSRGTGLSHAKVETWLGGLVRCGGCGNLLKSSFTSCHGRRHLYYFCQAGKKSVPTCSQRPVACADLDASLRERFEHMRVRDFVCSHKFGTFSPDRIELEAGATQSGPPAYYATVSLPCRSGLRLDPGVEAASPALPFRG